MSFGTACESACGLCGYPFRRHDRPCPGCVVIAARPGRPEVRVTGVEKIGGDLLLRAESGEVRRFAVERLWHIADVVHAAPRYYTAGEHGYEVWDRDVRIATARGSAGAAAIAAALNAAEQPK